SLLLAYLIGGMTLIPLVLCVLYFSTQKKHVERTVDVLENQKDEFYKVGWLQVDHIHTLGKATSIGTIVKSYLSSKHPTPPYFAVLKFNTLYLYDSELQLDCKGIIHVNNHTVHIYPYGLKDHELFSKSSRILLKKKKRLFLEDTQQQKEYYLNCSRSVDKEDWYFALLKANKPSLQATEPKDATVFDQDAMNHLISTIHSNPSQFEMQWFNALLGRIFLGIYKTERTKSFFYNKILSKIEKLNARRPPFLEEISLRSVDGGHGPPQITQPRFIHLSPQGEYTGDVQLSYDGHFRVELETVLTWKYSDRLPPIRIDLVLAITLKSIEGKLMIKIKEPPTNRAWLGFYRKPKMEWIVEPVVWEKRIGFSVVSKAIQTKIEEILAETLVLPNMDDMVFFQTDGVGGIFE
ncbi:putative integral membrane protein conserved region-domain-containing protein, partial [Gilbertella persicaria]|uniref:putative integral membrane protein conserved region-domain-containing protein n=1 Tax=Gilbertella persicaria TaxID=101096 RepID=UPI00221FEEBD